MARGKGAGLIRRWNEANKPDKATELKIRRWLSAGTMPAEALEIEWEAEDWLKDRSKPTPDFVACIAWYGKTRLMLQGWKLPIDVPESDFDEWREVGYYMTIEDFQKDLAGVAGGFLELAARDPQLFVGIIQQQLAEKLARLDELANLPLEDYTPQITEAALTAKYTAKGLGEAEVREAVSEILLDSDDIVESRDIDRPFVLYEQLICFEWGMEKFNMFAISEHSNELNLPNKKLYETLGQIDLNQLLARLAKVEPKLKAILHHLAKYQYFRLDNPVAPEGFWWRHWRREMEKQRQERQARGGHKPQRKGSSSQSDSGRGQQPRPSGNPPQQ